MKKLLSLSLVLIAIGGYALAQSLGPPSLGSSSGSGSTVSGANPTATAGPTAINGSAPSFMRSDAAPAIQPASNTQAGIIQLNGGTMMATANPTGVTSTAFVMLGLGSSCQITPVNSTRVAIQMYGSYTNSIGAANVGNEPRWGTGAPPGNGVAATGTLFASNYNSTPGAGQSLLFNVGGIIAALTKGTSIWVDLATTSATGTNTFSPVTCYGSEVY